MKRLALFMAAMAVSLPARAGDTVNTIRMAGVGTWFDGSKPVGTGSKQRYDGGMVGMEVDMIRAPADVGLAMRFAFGGAWASSQSEGSRTFGIDFGLAFPVVRGQTFGLVLTGGGGGDFGRHPFAPRGRLYPFLDARTRLFVAERTAFDLGVRLLPITSAAVHDHSLEAQLGVSVGMFYAGVRGTRTWFSDVAPARSHVDLAVSGLVGLTIL